MEWISTKDKMPEDGQKIIFLTTHLLEAPDNIYTGIKWDHKMHFSQQRMIQHDHLYMHAVTHWMPIPKPPKQ